MNNLQRFHIQNKEKAWQQIYKCISHASGRVDSQRMLQMYLSVDSLSSRSCNLVLSRTMKFIL
jgi:hypothetical protein